MTEDDVVLEENKGWREDCSIDDNEVDNCHTDYHCDKEQKTCWGGLCKVDFDCHNSGEVECI